MKMHLMLAALVLGVGASSALAQAPADKAPAGRGQHRHPRSSVEACSADAAKFCPEMKAGDGALGPCLKKHEAELSPACRGFMARPAAEDKKRNAAKSCQEDTAKFCSGMMPGDGKWGPCIRSHEAELSGPCKAGMSGRGGHKKKPTPPEKAAPPR